MTEDQRGEELIFVTLLGEAGWDATLFSDLLHSGTWMNPQGSAEYVNAFAALSLDLYLEVRMLMLSIAAEGGEPGQRFTLEYAGHLGGVLKALCLVHDALGGPEQAGDLKTVFTLCTAVWRVDEQGVRQPVTL